MKDVVTDYWFNYKMATIEFGDTAPESKTHVLKSKFAIVTIHDASPEFSEAIFKAADKLQKLKIPFNFAVVPRFKEKKENDLKNNPDFIEALKEYGQPVALHGLYHEHGRHEIEDYYQMSEEKVKHDLDSAIKILQESGIKSTVFIPPTWAVNKQTMDILENLGFSIVETEAEILILDKNTRLHTEILNWDTGHMMSERIFLKINRGSFREKVMNNVQMVRMAIHPRDPPDALADQVEMIEGLKNINYNFLSYRDIGRLFG